MMKAFERRISLAARGIARGGCPQKKVHRTLDQHHHLLGEPIGVSRKTPK
jgi:hypothetical protein